MFYSKSTQGFYDPEINNVIPDDAVEITADEHAALMAAQEVGKIITVDADGKPIAVEPESLMTLSHMKSWKSVLIDTAYAAAAVQPVSFKTAAGVTQTFQADSESQDVLLKAAQGYTISGAVPTGFFWKAQDNTLVAFTLADLQGLYATMLAQGWAAFQKRTALKAEISAATNIAVVQAITWG